MGWCGGTFVESNAGDFQMRNIVEHHCRASVRLCRVNLHIAEREPVDVPAVQG